MHKRFGAGEWDTNSLAQRTKCYSAASQHFDSVNIILELENIPHLLSIWGSLTHIGIHRINSSDSERVNKREWKRERYPSILSMRGSCEMWTIIGCSNSWFKKLNTNVYRSKIIIHCDRAIARIMNVSISSSSRSSCCITNNNSNSSCVVATRCCI